MQTTLTADPMVNLNGSVKINTDLTYYYGNSLGGIMGDVYMATTVDVKKGTSIVYSEIHRQYIVKSQERCLNEMCSYAYIV